MLETMGFTPDAADTCGCNKLKGQMDRAGVAGCLCERTAIAKHLQKAAAKMGMECPALEPFYALVDQAIAAVADVLPPAERIPLDLTRTAYERTYNASILERGDRRFLFFRTEFTNPRIAVIEIDRQWQAVGEHKQLALPEIPETSARSGMFEDPRVVLHNDRTFLAYTGYGAKMRSTCMIAEMDDDFNVVSNLIPEYGPRQHGEKNWTWFSSGGELYCIYHPSPVHRVLRLEGEKLVPVAEHRWRASGWRWGEIRGGASPVLHNGEWWHFFHSTLRGKEHKLWAMGLYTFCPETFKVLRWIPKPLMIPSHAERPTDEHAFCVFPCGAIREGDDWLVSYGLYDQTCEVGRWKMADLEKELRTV